MAVGAAGETVREAAWSLGWSGSVDRGGEHLLSGDLVELDLAHWVFQCGVVWTWTARIAVLTDGELSELCFAPVGVAVNVDVGDTHCGGGNVSTGRCFGM